VPSVIEKILELARWAPSGDNTQPWRFEIKDDQHVLVHGFDTRKNCVYDLGGFGSQLAHGALLETLRIVATNFGLRTEVVRHEDALETHPVYDVKFYQDAQVESDPLFPYIERRCTQRRPFRVTPLTQDEKKALRESVGEAYTIHWIEGWNGRWAMSKLLFASAWIRLTIPETYEVHRAIIQWNARESEDRIPDAAIGLDPLTLKLMRWAMESWKRVAFLNNHLAGHILPRIELDMLPALRCAAHFVIQRNAEPQGLDDNVDSGRAVQRFWLTATQLGLQLQPEMTPLVFSRYVHRGIPFTQVRSAARRAEEVAAVLGQLGGGTPGRSVFMGRIGRGHPPQARSMRLPLAKLLEFSNIAE
jgi:nitroreductase